MSDSTASAFTLARQRIDALPKKVILEELRTAAEHFDGRRFSRREFDAIAKHCKGTTVLKHFATWDAALESLGIALRPHRTDRNRISDTELLAELARVWGNLGHRPSKIEWEASRAQYSYTTYKQRFGGWTSACASLVDRTAQVTSSASGTGLSAEVRIHVEAIPAERKRDVPLKLRLKILSRDGFKCVLCGRTPALDHGAILHVDHIVPFSAGGGTTEPNLRTLCEQCNWGKGDDTTAG